MKTKDIGKFLGASFLFGFGRQKMGQGKKKPQIAKSLFPMALGYLMKKRKDKSR